ncbi:putative alpha-1,6-mannanase (GH76 family) [Dysgonomonas hofstadii]|uniref:Putative alpha-1,6-mannanase (GH76 family) n=1 Tax=Dysgonomonas hofstadii TaxID=637886 RepID=A0A840CMH5_9BACT|nr:glycoside hydrolase family 76 protein [Dysgonomonas hofstadii]MBB4037257.1 putative alpha-1,6-mannanase (GH76 family) [Dysgonomonas hofstadii]
MNNRYLIISISLLLCFVFSSTLYGEKPSKRKKNKNNISWNKAADYSTGLLMDNFWRVPDNGFTGDQPPYHFTIGIKGQEDRSNNYWPQAHAMDVAIDAYLRAKRKKNKEAISFYKKCFDEGYRDPIGNGDVKNKAGVLWTSYGMPKYSKISACFGNQFVDDMEWHALTLIRLYEATEEAVYLKEAQKLYAQIWEAWDLPSVRELGGNGGFLWCFGKEDTPSGLSKNACSNGPGCLTAIRLHEVKQNTPKERYRTDSHPDYVDFDYLENAKTVYKWMAKELFNSETGQVYGSISQKKGLHKAYSLTYDQGTFVGSAHLLHKYTNENHYLDDAVKAALYTITHPGITKNGMLRDEGAGGDNSLFKGIFIRYAVGLVNDPAIKLETRTQFYNFIRHQAETLWTKGLTRDANNKPTGFFTPDWSLNQQEVAKKGADYQTPRLGWQVSGATLLEAMNVMKKPK